MVLEGLLLYKRLTTLQVAWLASCQKYDEFAVSDIK